MLREQLLNLPFVPGRIGWTKSNMGKSWLAASIQQHAGRHPMYSKLACPLPFGIEAHLEARRKFAQETVGVLAIAIDVYGDNRESTIRVMLLHLIHPGEGLSTRRAPRRPENQIHHTPVKRAQVLIISAGKTDSDGHAQGGQ